MVLATDYPFLDVMWTMFVFFAWVIWFWLLIVVFGDVFRRPDISGFGKTLWVIFVIVLPYIGVLAYIATQGNGMAERTAHQQQAAKSQADEYIRSVATDADPAAQIARGKELLDSGAITQAEFDALKQKALA